MKEFDEQFPELKESKLLRNPNDVDVKNISTYTDYICLSDVREECLSKQRVREAIEKLSNQSYEFYSKQTLRELKKELGL